MWGRLWPGHHWLHVSPISLYQGTISILRASRYPCQLKSWAQQSAECWAISLSPEHSAVPSGEGLEELVLHILAVVLQDTPLWGHGFVFIQCIPGLRIGQGDMAFYWGNCPPSFYHWSLISFDATNWVVSWLVALLFCPQGHCVLLTISAAQQISGLLTLPLTTIIMSSWLLTTKCHIVILPLLFKCSIVPIAQFCNSLLCH